MSLQNDSNLSAGLPCGGGVSFSGVSAGGVVSVGVVGAVLVGGGVVSVVSVGSDVVGGSVSGIVSSGGFAGLAAGSSSDPQPETSRARPSSASVARRAISALRRAGAARSAGSR